MFIKEVTPKVIKNSRGEKTIEIILKTHTGTFRASAPSGKSKGKFETEQWNQYGVKQSMKILRLIAKQMRQKNFMIKELDDLKEIKRLVEKVEYHYGKIGGNANFALQTALLKGAAHERGIDLWELVQGSSRKLKIPMPVGNCIGGGLHSKKVNNKRPDFQEFHLIPDEKTFSKAVTKNIHAYDYARILLKKAEDKWRIKTNDENAWTTSLTNEQVLDVLTKVAEKYNLRIGLDVAASSFYKDGYYNYQNKALIRDRADQLDYMERLIEKYKIFYVEDPFEEEDFSSFQQLVKDCPRKSTLIVGDDLTVTHLERTRRAIHSNSINAMIIKPNQVGDLLEVKKVVELCKANKIKMIFSHRSGETMDDALADFAVGFGADFIKTGIYGKERLVKLRRIIEIENEF